MKNKRKQRIKAYTDHYGDLINVEIPHNLTWNLDSTLAILIRDSLQAFLDNGLVGYPHVYEFKGGLDAWRRDIEVVRDRFDAYAKHTDNAPSVKMSFRMLGDIFSGLWT